MIKLFLTQLDLSQPYTIERDLRNMEDQVNSFIRQGTVAPLQNQFEVVQLGANYFVSILLEYNLSKS